MRRGVKRLGILSEIFNILIDGGVTETETEDDGSDDRRHGSDCQCQECHPSPWSD
jgi:hypothetical protein